MQHKHLDRVIALSGIYQAVDCVIRIARYGTVDSEAMEPLIYSLFQIEAADVTAVFGKAGAVATGARQIIAQLTGKPARNLELTRYAVLLIRLERNLAKQPAMLTTISEGIVTANFKREHFSLLHNNLIAHFADLYTATISQLSPRILIRGEAVHLQNIDNQNRIRALLLAGVRCARLWRQIGGTRWQILFNSKQILTDASNYVKTSAAIIGK